MTKGLMGSHPCHPYCLQRKTTQSVVSPLHTICVWPMHWVCIGLTHITMCSRDTSQRCHTLVTLVTSKHSIPVHSIMNALQMTNRTSGFYNHVILNVFRMKQRQCCIIICTQMNVSNALGLHWCYTHYDVRIIYITIVLKFWVHSSRVNTTYMTRRISGSQPRHLTRHQIETTNMLYHDLFT